jgi:hypothetical protein
MQGLSGTLPDMGSAVATKLRALNLGNTGLEQCPPNHLAALGSGNHTGKVHPHGFGTISQSVSQSVNANACAQSSSEQHPSALLNRLHAHGLSVSLHEPCTSADSLVVTNTHILLFLQLQTDQK